MGIFSSNSELDLFIDNNMIYQYYRNRLVTLALSQFIWDFGKWGETCDQFYFEKKLLFEGRAALMHPEGANPDEWISVGYVPNGTLNIYGYPTDIKGIGFNATNIKPDEWVICYDNPLRQPIMCYIDLYARLLWECHMVFRSNLKHQNTPYIFKGNKNQELSFRNLFLQLSGYRPYILARRQEDIDAIQVLKTEAQFHGKELLEVLKIIWAEAISMLGIAPAAEIDKKERMVTDEIAFHREEYIISRNSRELTRKKMCGRINNYHGGNISVHMATLDLSLPLDMAAAELGYVSNQDTDAAPGEVI